MTRNIKPNKNILYSLFLDDICERDHRYKYIPDFLETYTFLYFLPTKYLLYERLHLVKFQDLTIITGSSLQERF